MSIFKGGWTNLINWGSNVVSVSLWLPVLTLILGIVNAVMINIFNMIQTDNSAEIKDGSSANGHLLYVLAVTIVFFGLKVSFMSKVPTIISAWISGGGASSSGFAGGFVPVKLSAGAAASAAVATANVASKVTSFVSRRL